MYKLSLKFLSYVPEQYPLGSNVRFKVEIKNKSNEDLKDKWVEIGVSIQDDGGDYNKKTSFPLYIRNIPAGESIEIVTPYPGWNVTKKNFSMSLSVENVFSANEFQATSSFTKGSAIYKLSDSGISGSIIAKTQDTLMQYMGFTVLALAVLTSITLWKGLIQPLIESQSESISYTAEQSRKFYILLAKIQALTNADRVILLQSYMEGGAKSAMTLKPTHEVVSQAIDYASPSISPISPFCVSQIFQALSNKDLKCRITQFTTIDAYKSFLEDMGVLGSCSILIENNDTPLGVLVLHYCKDIDAMSRANSKIIQPACRELSTLLSKKRAGLLSLLLKTLLKFSPF